MTEESMKVLGIYGASGLGGEVLELGRIINKKIKHWDKFIFIDDGDVPSSAYGCPVYRYSDAKTKYCPNLEIIVAIGEPAIREKLIRKIQEDRIVSPNLIHPDVYIPLSSSIGIGVVIQYGNFISCNVEIGNYVFIQPQCNIGHDVVLEEGCMISGFSNLGGLVHVGEWAYLGLSCAIKQVTNIGARAVVSMGAIVHKDVPDGMVVMGNPARPIAKSENSTIFKH